MATDTRISAYGPITFTNLRNVFGVSNASLDLIEMDDMTVAKLGDIGQGSLISSNALSVDSFRDKNLPLPVVTFTPNINANYSSTFEASDITGTLATNYTYRKRIIRRFTLNNSVIDVKKQVVDRGLVLNVDGSNYPISTIENPQFPSTSSNVQGDLTPYGTAIVSKVVPYYFTGQKRNGLSVQYDWGQFDVTDVLENRVNKFNFTVPTTVLNHNTHQPGHNSGHHHHQGNESPCRSMYGGCQTCHSDFRHHGNHHQNTHRLNINQATTAVASAVTNTAVTGPTTSCAASWNLTVTPNWSTTAIQFGQRSAQLVRTVQHNHQHAQHTSHGGGPTTHHGYC